MSLIWLCSDKSITCGFLTHSWTSNNVKISSSTTRVSLWMTTTACVRSTEVSSHFSCKMWAKVESKKQWKDLMRQLRLTLKINTGLTNTSMKSLKSFCRLRLTALTSRWTSQHTSSTSTTHSTVITVLKILSERLQNTRHCSIRFLPVVGWVTRRQQVRLAFCSCTSRQYFHKTSQTKNLFWTRRKTPSASSQQPTQDPASLQ